MEVCTQRHTPHSSDCLALNSPCRTHPHAQRYRNAFGTTETMKPSLLDLPTELLLEILRFQSLHTYISLLQTSKKFHTLLRDLVVVVGHSEQDHEDSNCGSLSVLRRAYIDKLSLRDIDQLIEKYRYFVFNMSGISGDSKELNTSGSVKVLKIMLRSLQAQERYHTVVIESANFNHDTLMRSLIPKFNSSFVEFYLPKTSQISGFEDLRLLDNTRCYFSNLERITIGSLSFQLFECTAPRLKVFDHSNQIITRAIYDTVNVRRVSYTSFLSVLVQSCAKSIRYLEVLGHVDPKVLKQFENLDTIHIFGDHVTKSFDAGAFPKLKEIIMSKCNNLEEVTNIGLNVHTIDFSNNQSFKQLLKGPFNGLKLLNLSNTAVEDVPSLSTATIIANGCHFLHK